MSVVEEKQMLTPPELSRRWGVNVNKVHALIQNGEIQAINLAINPAGKQRLRIYLSEVEKFEATRSTKPFEPKPRRRRRAAAAVKDYFAAS